MRNIYSTIILLGVFLVLMGCQSQVETMVLLDEEVSEINLSLSNGTGEMNDEIIFTVKDEKDVEIFENAILTATKQNNYGKLEIPHYDVMVEYKSDEGKLPTHAIHLWLGEENENSIFTYMLSDDVYFTSPKVTGELRGILLAEK